MKMKKLLSAALALCLLLALTPAASAAETPGLGDVLKLLAPELDGGLDGIIDWLKDGAATLAPEVQDILRQMSNEDFFDEIRELAALDDDALREKLRSVGTQYGFTLTDEQVQQLIHLCRTVEKLDPRLLTECIESLRDTVEQPGSLRGIWNGVVRSVKSFVSWLADKAKTLLG